MMYGVRVQGGDRPRGRIASTRFLPLSSVSPADRFARSRPRLLTIAACALILGVSGGLDAQTPEPLTKSEVLSLLATGAYSSQELADLLGRRCVIFDATERDLGHVRLLGGDEQVVAALVSCRAARRPAPAPPPAPATALAPPAAGDTSAAVERQPPAPEAREAESAPVPSEDPRAGEASDPPAATARVSPSTLTLTAGENGTIAVDVTLGGRPLPGLEVLLGGRGAPTGDALQGVTDARGRVEFTVVAGTTARLYNLPVRSVDGRLPERTGLLLEVVPGPASRALLSPPRVRIGPLAETTLRIRAAVTDDYGNPIVGERIELLHPQGNLVAAAVTDERGSAPLVFDTAAIGEAPLLLLFLADRALAELPVERDPDR